MDASVVIMGVAGCGKSTLGTAVTAAEGSALKRAYRDRLRGQERE